MAADVAVFDLAQLGWGDRYAVYDMPGGEPRLIRDAAGVHWVMGNGDVIVEHGNHTGA